MCNAVMLCGCSFCVTLVAGAFAQGDVDVPITNLESLVYEMMPPAVFYWTPRKYKQWKSQNLPKTLHPMIQVHVRKLRKRALVDMNNKSVVIIP